MQTHTATTATTTRSHSICTAKFVLTKSLVAISGTQCASLYSARHRRTAGDRRNRRFLFYHRIYLFGNCVAASHIHTNCPAASAWHGQRKCPNIAEVDSIRIDVFEYLKWATLIVHVSCVCRRPATKVK